MSQSVNRRDFVKKCILTGAGILSGPSLAKAIERGFFPSIETPLEYELSGVVGDRIFENTLKAVDAIGGMQRFVKPGKTVGLLINSPFDRRGAHTNPDIAIAAVKMCVDAGAKQITMLRDTGRTYWRRSALYEKLKTDIDRVSVSDEKKDVRIETGKVLKSAEISHGLLSCDVFINLPIIKDHEGTRYTCTLKNMMGACSSATCRTMHFGDASLLNYFKGFYSNVEILTQSIADLSLVRQPDLSIVDATEILASNGPSGPGEIKTPREVIASTNGLAADMYASRHLGLDWNELLVIRFAHEHGLGPKTLNEVKIRNL